MARLAPGLLSLSLSLSTLAAPARAGDLFVDVDVTTGADDGSSWADAFQGVDGLARALAVATAGDRILVAEGRYKATAGLDRAATHDLVTGVELYGGCVGTETDPSQRPPFGAAPTVLDGDLADDDGSGSTVENTYSLLRAVDVTGVVLDGFVVRGGRADAVGTGPTAGAGLLAYGCELTVRWCRFEHHRSYASGACAYLGHGVPAGVSFADCEFRSGTTLEGTGGGFASHQSPGVRFERCRFLQNSAAGGGALRTSTGTSVVLVDCVLWGNRATGFTVGGGALWVGFQSQAELTGCTVARNVSLNHHAAGLWSESATLVVRNGILWGNFKNNATGTLQQVSGSATVEQSIVGGGLAGQGNLAADPLFVDGPGGDLRLRFGSPAIDSGDSTLVPAGSTTDLAGNPRVVDDPTTPDTGPVSPAVDRGAYEYAATPVGMPDPGCAPVANSTGVPSETIAVGHLDLADPDLRLATGALPSGEFGYYLMSESMAAIPVSAGVLCLGGPQYRFQANVLDSGAQGWVSFAPDPGDLPQGQVFLPGSTWWFQYWHRDGANSNFSNSLGVTWP